jgi:ElaB/YqjD/DUF883 family membrane-anchored ribosome-binding protein
MIRDHNSEGQTPLTTDHHIHSTNTAPLLQRISWSAIIAGAVLAMVVSLILNLLGTAVGSASIDPLEEGNPLSGMGTGAGIWLVVSGVISLFIGGWVAGRLSQREGALHGVLVWATVSLVTVYLVSSAVTGVVRGGMSLAGSGISAVGSGIAQVAPSVGNTVQDQLRQQGIEFDLNDVQSEIETAMRQTGKPELDPANVEREAQEAGNDAQQTAQRSAENPQQADNQLGDLLNRVKEKGDEAWNAADREAMVNLIKARTGKSDAEANQIVDQAQESYRKAYAQYEELKATAEQKAREAADVAAKRVSQASWILLAMLVLSGIVAGVAGMLGRRSQPPAKVVTTV